MAYQQGSQNIANGASTVSVVFPVTMEDTPPLVVVSIENVTDVAPLQHLDPVVKTKSAAGFTVELAAATTSANYKLTWFAGTPNQEYQTVSASGVKVTRLPRRASAPGASDLVVLVNMTDGAPVTEAVPWQYISSVFGKMVSVPAGPTSEGAQGQWAMDANYFYSHDGSTWGRTPRVISDWDLPANTELIQEGIVSIADAQSSVTVVFDNEYADPPNVGFVFENTITQASKQILSGLITSRSTTGFTVTLNTTTEGTNYRMNWRAEGEPA